jgi:hypothetical protein
MKSAVLLFVLALNIAAAQVPSWTWVRNTPANFTKLGADKHGDIYAAGPGVYSSRWLYLAKYNAAGTLLWEKKIIGPGPDSILVINDLQMATDANGNSFVAASVMAKNLVVGSYQVQIPTTNQQQTDIIVLKVLPDGQVEWVKTFGSMYAEYVGDLALTAAGGVLLFGRYNGNIVVGNDTLTSPLFDDIFTVKIDKSGNYQWAEATNLAGWDIPWAITEVNDGHIYEVIQYYDQKYKLAKRASDGSPVWLRELSFDCSPFHFEADGSTLYVSGGSAVTAFDTSGGFLSKRVLSGVCNSPRIHDLKVSGGTVWYAGDFHADTLFLDSWFATNSYTYASNHGPYKGGGLFAAEAAGGQFNWMKAADGFCNRWASAIVNVPGKGTFVTGGGDSTLSFEGLVHGPKERWHFIARIAQPDPVALIETRQSTGISVFPNPASSACVVQFEKMNGSCHFRLCDLLGNTVRSGSFTLVNGESLIQLAGLTPGLYLATFGNSSFTETIRLVVE